jgi:predicted nucleotidyltransferase
MNVEQQTIFDNTILRGTVGSTAHGLALDGTDDRDEMGVCIEPMKYVVGLSNFEQLIFRTAAIRDQMHDARSQHGDLDLVIYSLRKYVRLALKGNPTILGLLFLPKYTIETAAGTDLVFIREQFVSKRAGRAFLGYLTSQKQRLVGERGGKHGVRHVGPMGYDTKYATHMLRLGYQGCELMETGRLELPMTGRPQEFLMQVRHGWMAQDFVMYKAASLEARLESLISSTKVPDHPDEQKVEQWLIDHYREAWTPPTRDY